MKKPFGTFNLLFFAYQRVTRTSKAMQTTAFRTVAYSLPQNEVILLTFLISERFIPYTDLHGNVGLYDLALLCLFLCTSVFNIKNHTDVLQFIFDWL